MIYVNTGNGLWAERNMQPAPHVNYSGVFVMAFFSVRPPSLVPITTEIFLLDAAHSESLGTSYPAFTASDVKGIPSESRSRAKTKARQCLSDGNSHDPK